jgi:3-phenylpropionate/trans-cinnamate dioxygenase ferredoxin reductase subunit
MLEDKTFVIIGAGHAGGRAAQALRVAGFAGRVILVGEETFIPYERPPLSKDLLTTDSGVEKAELNPEAFYKDKNIELLLGVRGQSIDRAAHTVTLSDGRSLKYDKLMLTTGARVRKIPLPGSELPGVHYLRDFNDTLNIRAALIKGGRVIVIGGGFIGLEAAASARKRGCEVTVLEATDRLMGRAVAVEIGNYFADYHRKQGVDLRLGASVSRIEGAGKVERVVLGTGETIDCALVIIGVGILPNVEIAQEAGLKVENGIVVDEFGVTSDPDIYAAGDAVNLPLKSLGGRRVRLESYQNAQNTAMAVARNMLGEPKPVGETPWVWTDQYDVNLQMVGMPEKWSKLVYRGNVDEGRFTVFYLDETNRIVGVNTINNGRERTLSQRLLEAGQPVDPVKLANTDIRLNKLNES